jgi:hypothetical protein
MLLLLLLLLPPLLLMLLPPPPPILRRLRPCPWRWLSEAAPQQRQGRAPVPRALLPHSRRAPAAALAQAARVGASG